MTGEYVVATSARFGDKDGALGLTAAPAILRDFFVALTPASDLPDSAPLGSSWKPFVRGWCNQDYYIFSITRPDLDSKRPGMIGTEMFAIPIERAMRLSSIGDVIHALHIERPYSPEVTIALHEPGRKLVSAEDLERAVRTLIAGVRPVVVIGQDGFEELVVEVWRVLAPEVRRAFRFGFSFTPSDLQHSGLHMAAVPESCRSRWISFDQALEAHDSPKFCEGVDAVLKEGFRQEFEAFLQQFNLKIKSIADYARYVRFQRYWNERHKGDAVALLALLRNFAAFAPDPRVLAEEKREAVELLCALLKEAPSAQILSLRALVPSSLGESAMRIGRAICDWVVKQCSLYEAGVSNIRSVLAGLTDSHSSDWNTWIRLGLKRAFMPTGTFAPEIVWSLWVSEEYFDEVTSQIGNDPYIERELARTVPAQLTAALVTRVTILARKREWRLLLGLVTLNSAGFDQAIQAILSPKTIGAADSVITTLCSKARPNDVWSGAEKFGSALFDCAARAALREPQLWFSDALSISSWGLIFDRAASIEGRFLSKIDADAAVRKLFAFIGTGGAVGDATCSALASIRRLEFSTCPNRPQLWSRIPQAFLRDALRNTLQKVMCELYERGEPLPELEAELVNQLFVRENEEVTFPQGSRMLCKVGLCIVKRWGDQSACERWLNALAGRAENVSESEAEAAGIFILQMGWGTAAKLAKTVDKKLGRADFRPMWTKYYDGLGKLDKLVFDYFMDAEPAIVGEGIDSFSDQTVEALFVTALPEEFAAVTKHLQPTREHVERGTIYEIGTFLAQDDLRANVAVVQTGMGNSQSAAATERALSLFKPKFAFFVGIAGGLREDLAIGDVIVASKVYGYEAGKAGSVFLPRPEAMPVSHAAEQRANAVLRTEKWKDRITPKLDPPPKAYVKPLAAGEKVLVSMSSVEMQRVKGVYSDAYGVAMEDHGFAIAVRAHPLVCFSVIRGISDLIENKEAADKGGSHELAARNAAAFAFEMLAGLMRTNIT